MAAFQLQDSDLIRYKCDVCGAAQSASCDEECEYEHGWHVVPEHAFCANCKAEPCDVCEPRGDAK